MLRGLVTAFRTLTIFPIPGQEASDHSAALPFFPLVGALLGFLLWLVSLSNLLLAGNGWPMGIALLILLANIIGTRALHLDGLADFADAVGGSWDRENRLRILKDTRLGVFGGIAIIFVLLCKWLAFSKLVACGSTMWIILITTISRTMQVNLAVRLDYARSQAGTASSFVSQASAQHRVAAFASTLIVAAIFGPFGLAALALAETIIWTYGWWCHKNFGGITGDLLGAGNEIIEVVLFFSAALVGETLVVYTGWGWVFH
jgi:adenosylcobinamide-GDP ribazoletransferase